MSEETKPFKPCIRKFSCVDEPEDSVEFEIIGANTSLPLRLNVQITSPFIGDVCVSLDHRDVRSLIPYFQKVDEEMAMVRVTVEKGE